MITRGEKMPDFALIALSPAWIGSNEYIRNEREKVLLLYQYLKKIGYRPIFFTEEGCSFLLFNKSEKI